MGATEVVPRCFVHCVFVAFIARLRVACRRALRRQLECREPVRPGRRSQRRVRRRLHAAVAEEVDEGAARDQAQQSGQDHQQDERRQGAGCARAVRDRESQSRRDARGEARAAGPEVRNRPQGFAQRPRHRHRADLRRQRVRSGRFEVSLRRRRKDPRHRRSQTEARRRRRRATRCTCSSITGRRGTTTNGSGSWRPRCSASGSTKSSPPIPRPTSCMVGDFNDEPDNVVDRQVPARRRRRPKCLPTARSSTRRPHIAAEGKGTFVWDDKWELIDHIIVSPGLLDGEGFAWKTGSSQRLEFPELFFHPRWPKARFRGRRRAIPRTIPQGRLFRPPGRRLHHQRLTARDSPRPGSRNRSAGRLKMGVDV